MKLSHPARAALAVAIAVSFMQPALAANEKAAGEPVTIQLGAQNQSRESGTAKLTPLDGGQTKVEISLKNAPKDVAQPAHIHEGSCANLDPKPKQGLDNVVNGKSTTTVPVSLQELVDGKTAINVHKSAEEAKVYVACGDITASGKPAKK